MALAEKKIIINWPQISIEVMPFLRGTYVEVSNENLHNFSTFSQWGLVIGSKRPNYVAYVLLTESRYKECT